MTEPTELYLRYRPKKFSEVIGQESAVNTLVDMGRRKAMPHVLLFVGGSGTGKTTLARIVARKLKCTGLDFLELNAAKERGIEMVRGISQRMGLAPVSSPCRIWLLDEVGLLTHEGQSALLKMLEDTPQHVYFFLATTNPEKLKETIKTRCTTIACRAIRTADLELLVAKIAAAEGKTLDELVVEKIAETAQGSARAALVILHQIIGMETVEKQMAGIGDVDVSGDGFKIAQLLNNGRTRWPEMSAALSATDADPEGIRYVILGYFRKVLVGKGGNPARAAAIIESFQYNFFDSKAAGLAAACYSVIGGSK